MAINVKDFERIKAELNAALNNHEEWEKLEETYCGPGTGIWHDEKTDTIKIATGWVIDEEGYVRHGSEFKNSKVNVSDFEKIKAEIKKYADTPYWEAVEAKYCGPGTGVYFDKATDSVVVADGWKVDKDGFVKHDSEFGPGVQ